MVKVIFKISFCLICACFIRCASQPPVGDEVEQKSKYLADHIDSHSLSQLRQFGYGSRDGHHFWLKVSFDTSLYLCDYRANGDTAILSVWRPERFIRDYITTFRFDTSVYSKFTFVKVRDTIVRVEQDSIKGSTFVKGTAIAKSQIFPAKDPYATFAKLMSIVHQFGFEASSYGGDIGDFYVFKMSPQYKLLYIPDTLKMNPETKRYWLDLYRKGEKIKPHWSLVNLHQSGSDGK